MNKNPDKLETDSDSLNVHQDVDPTGCIGKGCENERCANPFCSKSIIPNFNNLVRYLEKVSSHLKIYSLNPYIYNGFDTFPIAERKKNIIHLTGIINDLYKNLEITQTCYEMSEDYIRSKGNFKGAILESVENTKEEEERPLCMACGYTNGLLFTQCNHAICTKCFETIGYCLQDVWICLVCTKEIANEKLKN